MRLTTKSRYGTRLVLDLAIYATDGPVPLSDISKRQNISQKYLEQLVGKLKTDGYIKSWRGPFGGHMLATTPDRISVGDIVRSMEGSPAITDCAEKDAQLCGVCNRAGDCLSRWVWIEAGKAMFSRLDSISIADLVRKNKASVIQKT